MSGLTIHLPLSDSPTKIRKKDRGPRIVTGTDLREAEAEREGLKTADQNTSTWISLTTIKTLEEELIIRHQRNKRTRRRHISRPKYVLFSKRYSQYYFRENVRKEVLVVSPMVKNKSEGCLISEKLDFASPLRTEIVQRAQTTVSMLTDKLKLGN